jgi:cyclophilin family peptidyl-prolyl cis-trans isomerase
MSYSVHAAPVGFSCAQLFIERKHTLHIGQVIDGMKIIRMIENVSVSANGNKPKLDTIITECGEM